MGVLLMLLGCTPGRRTSAQVALSDSTIIWLHVTTLTQTKDKRTHENIQQLNETADYIRTVFNRYSDSVYIQTYTANGNVYKNIICSFGTNNKKRIVVGAHYDVCGEQQGADDNASGVTGLLELSRLLNGKPLSYRIDLVAYTLEEPPYFRTEYMGSYIHAKSLVDHKVDVFGMVSLEMIGYFRDEEGSQEYPLKGMSLFYGNKGDYITLVDKFGSSPFAKKFSKQFKAAQLIKTKTFAGPAKLAGIDFSDHLNYWKFGIAALMITDTSFFRNKNYHKPTDTMETLDLKRMGKVIDAVYETLVSL
jgi:Zn-dependent M28 family amino/carboxypeptidase